MSQYHQPLLECVPNFSEGRDPVIIDAITQSIRSVDRVELLHVDPGRATHRTVMTFVGAPDAVIEAAYRAIRTASERIDMSIHSGEHPRMGATDVCPLIPIRGLSLEDCIQYAQQLGERVGDLGIPVYLYEAAAQQPDRKNLAVIRKGEYEGLQAKLADPHWKPDYGPALFNARSGATVIGVRDFLVAYNVNLNTRSARRANAVAFDVREKGRVLKKDGVIQRDAEGQALREPGRCKAVKGIGWYIEEYGMAQISMNLTDLSVTKLHEAYEACRDSARQRGMRVTGSELVGLVPLQVMLDAGRYYLTQQERSLGIPDRDIVDIAIQSLGLEEISPFDPEERIIEYRLAASQSNPLAEGSLRKFTQSTASESPAPGGGSVSAAIASLGASLGAMVANLSSHKRGWDQRWKYFSDQAARGEQLRHRLMELVDEDTRAFDRIMSAVRMPRSSPEEKSLRTEALQLATRRAMESPLEIMELAYQSIDLSEAMIDQGNPASLSDVGVALLCAQCAIEGAWMNVKINAPGLNDISDRSELLATGNKIMDRMNERIPRLLQAVHVRLDADIT